MIKIRLSLRNSGLTGRLLAVLPLLLLLAAGAYPARAATVELPLFLRANVLQNALEQSLNLQPDGRAALYRKDGYNYFYISNPRLDLSGESPRFICRAAAGAGFQPLGVLPAAINWSGTIDLKLLFYVDRNWQLRYRITGSDIYRDDGSRAVVTNFVWNLSREYLYPVLENFAFDLAVPRQEILSLIRLSALPDEARRIEDILHSLTIGPLRTNAAGVEAPLLLTLAGQPVPPDPVQEEKPLTGEELEAFQQVFEPMDAFLVFVVKIAGADFINPRQRAELFELLIASRYQLLAILAGEAPVDRGDPLRLLFVNAWRQLKAIIESSEGQGGLMQWQLLRYMTFINAGDALLVLDAAAPQLGLRITADGLRRLARMLNPGLQEDPLRFDWEIDPALRKLFDFRPEPQQETPSGGTGLLELLIGTAYAAEPSALIDEEERQRLNLWVPGSNELAEYTPLIAKLLKAATLEQGKAANLDTHYAAIYRHLVLATALMESCWRQYVVENDKIWFLRSPSGSIGIMQVNPHVWRGFYSIEKLRWDVVYNIRAGTQILMRYFTDYALKVAEKSGKPEYAARAAYSAYNAGPMAARRFLKKDASKREKQVDGRLWKYYQAIAAGGSVNLAACTVE